MILVSMIGTSTTWSSKTTGWLMTVWLLTSLLVSSTEGQCGGGTCGACERRFGCLTESWGRCCVQFFQHNGKRSGVGRNDAKMPSASSAESSSSLASAASVASFPDPFIKLVRKRLINLQTEGRLTRRQERDYQPEVDGPTKSRDIVF